MPYKDRLQGVYRLVNTATNKSYVGSSTHLYSRRSFHFRNLKRKSHWNYKLQEAYNVYGKENIIFEILEFVEKKEDLLKREQYYINKYDSFNNGYNILQYTGTSLGYKHTEATKRLMSQLSSGSNNYFWGKHLSDKHKENISKGNKGRKHSRETIEKVREAHFKPIINLDTGKEYSYISEAANDYKVSVTAISNALRGKAKTCKGCHWAYKEEE